MGFDEFESEYNDLSDDVINATHISYSQRLADFIELIEHSPYSKDRIIALLGDFDFTSWYNKCRASTSGMMGSGRLDWDRDRTKRLGQKISLFRHLSLEGNNFSDFAVVFVSSASDYNDMVYHINSQEFQPFARDLLKDLSRNVPHESIVADVPAADRIVTLDHNSKVYQDVIDQLQNIEEAILKSNEFSVKWPDEKERISAELSAGTQLLKPKKVRVEAIRAVLVAPLIWLSEKFTGALIGKLAETVLQKIFDWFDF